jgi:hypothetical protein
MMVRVTLRIALAACALGLVLSSRPAVAERIATVEHLLAQAASGPVDIVIEHWSPDQEREQLQAALVKGDPDLLAGALQLFKSRAGFVMFPGVRGRGARVRTRRGQNLQFAREITSKTGRQLILATYGRPGFDEWNREKPSPAEFMLLDIRIGPDGTGVGKLGATSAAVYNEETRTFELEHYDTQPVVLHEVRSEKP